MKRLRIAIVSDAVAPFNKGGKETRIAHLTDEFIKLGHQVDIYTMKWWDGGKTTTVNGVNYHAISKLHKLYAGDVRSIKSGVLFGIATLQMMRYKFDILEVDHMPFFPIYSAKVVAILKRKKLYATWHEVWGKEYWNEYLGGAKGYIAALIEKYSIYMPNHISAVSTHTLGELRTKLNYRGSAALAINGIDYKKIQKIKAARKEYDVLFAGRLLAHKNVDVLIESINMLKKDMPGITCAIVGDGPEFKSLETKIKKLKLDKNIFMLGFLPKEEDVYAYMKSSSVFVLPSSREGFGITVLEAHASGAHVVTVNEPSNAAQFLVEKDYGLVVDLDAKSIARAIKVLLDKPNRKESIDVESLDWGFTAASIVKEYTK